jgi:tRNA G37 N-methylase Trm5
LKEILPADSGEIPSGFETVGDIAHMNLSEKLMPYKYQIG